MQAPGQPDEDTSGGFQHGGWHMPYFDDLSRNWVVEGYTGAGGFLFGRRTYELLVASTTLAEPLEWEHATLLKGDVAEAVATLKQGEGGSLNVVGSTQLVHTLIEHDLVDQYRVMIDPLAVGGGKRLFADDGVTRPLRLVESQVTTTGAILATYAPA